jgi:hypothetical protein
VATRPPPGGRAALALHQEVVALHGAAHAGRFEQGGGAGQPVAFLHAQLAQAAEAAWGRARRRRHGQHRILVDHGGGAGGGHVHAAQFRGLGHQVAHRLAAS